jgi:hypothetical protein
MPNKRKRHQGTLDSFKRSKAFITPPRGPIKKNLRDNDSSKSSSSANTKLKLVVAHQENLPISIYKNCNYDMRGKSTTIATEFIEAASQIEEMCNIPVDFGRSIKFGALSGISYEERLVDSFLSDKIPLKKNKQKIFLNVLSNETMKNKMKDLSNEYDGDYDKISIERALYLMNGNVSKVKILLDE